MRDGVRRAAVASIALVAGACGYAGGVAGPGDVPSLGTGGSAAPPSLVGTSWRLASMDGHDALPGVRVTAQFLADARVAGSAGCNRYFGGAATTGEALSVGLLATTMMACSPDSVMQQEYAYVAALEKAKTYRVDGDRLELGPRRGVVTLVFARE